LIKEKNINFELLQANTATINNIIDLLLGQKLCGVNKQTVLEERHVSLFFCI
jgi:hypothetical protein